MSKKSPAVRLFPVDPHSGLIADQSVIVRRPSPRALAICDVRSDGNIHTIVLTTHRADAAQCADEYFCLGLGSHSEAEIVDRLARLNATDAGRDALFDPSTDAGSFEQTS